jgi:predicted amidohydrolase YtcJ
MLCSGVVFAQTTHIHNVNGYTLNSAGELQRFKQITFDADTIIAVGDDLLSTDADIVIDGNGQVMLPGIIDAHGHMLGLGDNLLSVDVRNAASERDAAQQVANFVAKHPQSSGWIVGRGWNQVLWPGKQFPTKSSLDKIAPNKPVVLSRVDGHAVWVNSAALQLAGITRDTPSPAGGDILKDAAGEPTGVLIDNAEYLVTKLMPKADREQLAEQLTAANAHLLAVGITSMHDAGISKQVYDFYQAQAAAGALDVRIYAMIAATDHHLPEMLKTGHIQDPQAMLSIRSVKAFGDGALGSRGAALLAPYSDDPHNHGLLVTPAEQLPTLFQTVLGADFQLNFHAIGDRANRLALQEFAKTFAIFPENSERHRIEHAQVVALEDIALFKEFGIIPSMQPTHATSDMNMAEDRIGAQRLKGAYAWQTFLQQGSRIAFGSDFPVELANPFHGLHAAVTRQSGLGKPADGWVPEERVSLVQALRGFTIDAAYAAFQDDILGTLEVGKKADFILIDRDIFAVEPALIRDTKVLQTWVNGERKY